MPEICAAPNTRPQSGSSEATTLYFSVRSYGSVLWTSSGLRDPRLDVLARRLRWLVTLANLPSLVGAVYRYLATGAGHTWAEPTPALALADLDWKLTPNASSLRGQRWPRVEPEPVFAGTILLEPHEDDAPPGSVWTDGSMVACRGGAAALTPMPP